MKKFLLSLAAIFVTLSSFATETEVSYIISQNGGKYVAQFEAKKNLYYVVVEYKFPFTDNSTERDKYIKKANEYPTPADSWFTEVDAEVDVWEEANPKDYNLSEDYACWIFDSSKVGNSGINRQSITFSSSSSNVISRSTDLDHHYVLYIQLRTGSDASTKVDKSDEKYSIDETDNTVTGKIDLTVDENAAVEVYNLSGVRMQGDNLPAGVYIRRQGNKVSKYVVR
jgi:hypothetical protein